MPLKERTANMIKILINERKFRERYADFQDLLLTSRMMFHTAIIVRRTIVFNNQQVDIVWIFLHMEMFSNGGDFQERGGT